MTDMGDSVEGAQLRKLRQDNGVSGRQLSRLSGLDPSTISKYERGERQISIKVLKKYVNGLGKNLRIIIGE